MKTQKLVIVVKAGSVKQVFSFPEGRFDKADETFINQCEILYDGRLPEDLKVKFLKEKNYLLCNSSVTLVKVPIVGSVSIIDTNKEV